MFREIQSNVRYVLFYALSHLYLTQRRFIQKITQKLPNNVGVSLYKATQYKTQVTRVT